MKRSKNYLPFSLKLAVTHIVRMRMVREVYIRWPVQTRLDEVIDHDEPVPESKQCQHQTHFARM